MEYHHYIVACVLWLLALNSQAATFFVATNGSNGNSGTIGSPWLTIRYGTLNMNSGDTLNIRAGIYPDDGFDLEEIKSGTGVATPTLIQSYQGEAVIYAPNASGDQAAHGIIISGKSNIVLNGWTVDARHCSSDGIKLDQGTLNVTLTNMTVFGCLRGMGILTTGVNEGDLMNGLITHCSIITNGWAATTNDAPLHQIYIQTSGMTVENCYIQGITNVGGGTVGIHYFGTSSTNGTFRNNWVTNCTTGILAASTAGSNCFIYNNLIFNGYSWGIRVYKMSSVYVLNNTVVTNNAQITVESSTNVFVENNICTYGYASDPGGIYLQASADTVSVRNNLSYSNIYSDFRITTAYNITTNANLFGIVEVGGVKTTNSYAYNAQFVSPSTGNYRLGAGSSAIGAGRAQTLFATDYGNRTRFAPWDIGAWKYAGNGFNRNVVVTRNLVIQPQ